MALGARRTGGRTCGRSRKPQTFGFEAIFLLKDLALVSAIAYASTKTDSFFLSRILVLFIDLTMLAAFARLFTWLNGAKWPRGLARLSPELAIADRVLTIAFAVAAMLALAVTPAVIAARAAKAGW